MKTFITAQLRHENVMDNYQISFRKETPENETKILLSYWNLVNILLAYIVTTFKKNELFFEKSLKLLLLQHKYIHFEKTISFLRNRW